MTLIEREAEVAALDAALAETVAGSGRLLVIGGPAGIGKSGLLADLRARAGDELLVLAARASELEREFGFGVVRQLFEATAADPARGPAALAGAAAPAASVLGAMDGAGVASFAALHGLFWLASNLAAEQPLLLAVDDLHWCDRPSLRFLAYLARRLEGLPILLATTVRSGDPGTDPTLLAEIALDPAAQALEPGPLSATGAAALVRERLGAAAEPAFCEACHAATGGNPLLLRQLLRALEAERVEPVAANAAVVRAVGPRAASSTVLVRLGRLPGAAVAVARAVSVLGEHAEVPAVAALAGLEEQAVAAATGELARAEILRPDPPLGFVHPLVRDAVYRELPPGERALLHERAAGLLRDAGAPSEQVAAQLLEAPRRGEAWVVDALEAAGATAMRRGAADSAVALLRRALEEPPAPDRRAQVLLGLGTAEALTNGPAAADHLREAYGLLDDPVERGRVADGLVRVLIFTDRAPEAAALAREARAALPPGEDALAETLDALEIATYYIGGGITVDGLVRVARARRPGAPAKQLALAAIDWAYRGGDADACCALAVEALERGGLIERENGVFAVSAIITLALADRDEAITWLDASLASAHHDGSLFAVASMHLFYGVTLLWRGDLAGAFAMLATGQDEFTSWGFGASGAVYLDAHLALVALERGDLATARRALERNRAGQRATDDLRFWLGADLQVLLAEGRLAEAMSTAEALELQFGAYTSPAAGRWRSFQALALDRLGRRDEALALVDLELAHARTWGAPGVIGHALRVRGTLRNDLGDLEEAVRVLDGSAARLDLAKALFALGGAVRRDRRPAEAREPLRRALELAAACDAPGLAEQVRTELYATGARPRSDAVAGVAALTASERRVADLAAGGSTNRDIAQALFVTPKTVEVHLSNAYRKLGIRSRRDLAATLAG